MIAASSPSPAMTRKACRRSPTHDPSPTCSSRWASSGFSRIQPTSMCRLRPVIATSTDFARSSVGISRLRASRLPVPPGSSPIGTPESTISWATARTVPSPPKAHTTSTFSASASAGLAEADVVLRGLDEQRLVPAVLRADPGDDLVHVVAGAVELGGVEHHREPLARGRRGVVDGAEAVAGRAAGRPLAVSRATTAAATARPARGPLRRRCPPRSTTRPTQCGRYSTARGSTGGGRSLPLRRLPA